MDLNKKLCDSLGIDWSGVTELKIEATADSFPRVTVTKVVRDLDEFLSIIEQYKVVKDE